MSVMSRRELDALMANKPCLGRGCTVDHSLQWMALACFCHPPTAVVSYLGGLLRLQCGGCGRDFMLVQVAEVATQQQPHPNAMERH